ncbi:hypothetical protein DL98DRAFT_474267 [Cadophora sp. DSE1049]|nr:hypothetical protein DL98DRAFT_474267 [Cadophora sp. DSE1049]
MRRSALPQDSAYTLTVSPETALDLIDGFFNHIHCFLPLFHPARFKEKYASLHYLSGKQSGGPSREPALILNGMFCLAARFSTASAFCTEEPIHRGDQFGAEATRLFEELSRELEDSHASLAFLHGVILLTFIALLSGPSRRAWWLTGVCVRLAHELDLHNTDADIICRDVDPLKLSLDAWHNREERRRAWWLVWDMDTFISATTLRPFAINRRGMHVLLPITDEAWLAADRISSSHLDPESTTPWEGLCDLPKQSAWSWFLACIVLLRQVVEVVLWPTTNRELNRIEASFRCFALAMPETFRADLDSVGPGGVHVKDVNWVKATLSMFNCCVVQLAFLRRKLNASNTLRGQMPQKDSFPSLPNSPPLLKNDSCDNFEKEMAQVARTCPPQSLAQITPFVAICLVGPALINLRGNRQRDSGSIDDLNLEILIFALKRLARHWMIARVLLGE